MELNYRKLFEDFIESVIFFTMRVSGSKSSLVTPFWLLWKRNKDE